MKIKAYLVLRNRDLGTLQHMVNEGIKNGWQPYGPLMDVKGDFAQPMVEYTVEETTNVTGRVP